MPLPHDGGGKLPLGLQAYLRREIARALSASSGSVGRLEAEAEAAAAAAAALQHQSQQVLQGIRAHVLTTTALGGAPSSKAVADRVRVVGLSVARRVARDSHLRARMLDASSVAEAATLVAEGQALAQQAVAHGENIVCQHSRLRVAAAAAANIDGAPRPLLDGEALRSYADSMASLAQRHWEAAEGAGHRIDWCVHTACDFFGGAHDDSNHKRPAETSNAAASSERKRPRNSVTGAYHPTPAVRLRGQVRYLRLLDAGSCFDPFRRFESLLPDNGLGGKDAKGCDIGFEVTAFDLCPAATAATTVWTADLLTLQITPHGDETNTSTHGGIGNARCPCPDSPGATLHSLPASSFDVVALVNVLSYIPLPLQRTEAVWRARQLLRSGGLLCLITPHSTNRSTSGASLPILSEWRR